MQYNYLFGIDGVEVRGSRWLTMPSLCIGAKSVLLLLLLAQFFHTSHGKVVGAAVIPHGDFAYDPSLVHNKNGSLKVHNAAIHAGDYISSLKPDIIVLTTPHGMSLTNNFAIYENSAGEGFAELGSDLHNKSFHKYKIFRSVNFAPTIANDLVDKLRANNHQNVSGMKNFADTYPQALRWGEIIPLTILSNETLTSSKVVVLSHPLRRYNHSKEMVSELLEVGKFLFHYFDAQFPNKRVVFVGSSDLAHTHLKSGPYGFSKYAEPFDLDVGKWAKDPEKEEDALLKDAANIEQYALSCGFPSLVMLHGFLRQDFSRFHPVLLANEHPTYYGMMVSTY